VRGEAMPQYEYFCEQCKKPFTKILTIAEYEKGGVKCPKCNSKKVKQQVTAFFAVTSKKS
jgi:putative FmdB family regulatory protein